MSTHDQNDVHVAPAGESASPAPLLTAKGASRRRFAKTAAGAGTGVVLTLASQPGMATVMCAKPSLDQSLSPTGKTRNWNVVASRPPSSVSSCAGRYPSYWARTDVTWPGLCNRNNTCSPTFYCASAPQYATCKMQDLLVGGYNVSFDTANSQIGAYMLATYLNVVNNLVTVMTIQEVKDMWKEIATYGTFKPSPGVVWNIPRVVDYLKSTMV